VRRLVQDVLDRHAAHRVADEAEPLPAEAVRELDRVGGGLGHRELAGLVKPGAVAAQVGKDVGELRGVQVVGQVAPAEGRAEPAVQRDDAVVTGSDLYIGASHALELSAPVHNSAGNVPADLRAPRITASDSPSSTVAEWRLGRADADQVPRSEGRDEGLRRGSR